MIGTEYETWIFRKCMNIWNDRSEDKDKARETVDLELRRLR